MKINRLFEIIYLLLDRKRMTAKELAEYFEVSTRTIYRDVEALSQSGIPIYMTKGKSGGIFLLPEYKLNKLVLTEAEKTNILSALHSLNSLDNSSMGETISKIATFFGGKSDSYLEIDFKDWGRIIEDQFEKAKGAILSHKILSFEYISSQSKKSHRRVEPYKLWFKSQHWYLKSFCLDRQELRIFRFTRMREAKIEDEVFIPRDLDLSYEEDFSTAPNTKIILKISSKLKFRVFDEFLKENIVENRDGSFTVILNLIEDEWLYGYILSFGAEATVEEPVRIKEIIKRKLEESLKNYL